MNAKEKVFTEIYETNHWGSSETRSGIGSEVQNITPFVDYLKSIIPAKKIKSVLDIGCGECTALPFWHNPSIRYTGIDICKDIVEKNKEKNIGNAYFIHDDFLNYDFYDDYDLIICRDVLIHYSNSEIKKILNKIEFTFRDNLLLVNHYARESNNSKRDIKSGGFAPVNLRCPPFVRITESIIGSYPDLKSGQRELLLIQL